MVKSKKRPNVFNLSRYKDMHDYSPEYLANLKATDPAAYKWLEDYVATHIYGYKHHADNTMWEELPVEERRKVYKEQYKRRNDAYAKHKSMFHPTPNQTDYLDVKVYEQHQWLQSHPTVNLEEERRIAEIDDAAEKNDVSNGK